MCDRQSPILISTSVRAQYREFDPPVSLHSFKVFAISNIRREVALRPVLGKAVLISIADC